MLMLVPLALGRAFIANSSAQFEHLAQYLLIGARVSYGELSSRLAYVRTIEAGPDALAHVHLFGRAGVSATEAHSRAVHEVMRRIAERLVDVAGEIGVKGDHLADGHC